MNDEGYVRGLEKASPLVEAVNSVQTTGAWVLKSILNILLNAGRRKVDDKLSVSLSKYVFAHAVWNLFFLSGCFAMVEEGGDVLAFSGMVPNIICRCSVRLILPSISSPRVFLVRSTKSYQNVIPRLFWFDCGEMYPFTRSRLTSRHGTQRLLHQRQRLGDVYEPSVRPDGTCDAYMPYALISQIGL
jgi:hypothetical protein